MAICLDIVHMSDSSVLEKGLKSRNKLFCQVAYDTAYSYTLAHFWNALKQRSNLTKKSGSMPQVYGAKNYGAMGVILQRAILICTTVGVFIIAAWSQIHGLLLLLGKTSRQKRKEGRKANLEQQISNLCISEHYQEVLPYI